MTISLTIRNWLQMPVSNESLMLRYAESQEQAALKILYDRCAADLYHFLLALTHPTLAEEISQRTWLQVIEKRHLYRQSGRFEAWLFTLGRNLLYDELRHQQRFTDSEGQEQAASNTDDTPIERHQMLIQHALAQLPFEQREAFCLQQEGFGLQEIADMCDCPTETIKSRVRYARQSMKTWLENHHGE